MIIYQRPYRQDSLRELIYDPEKQELAIGINIACGDDYIENFDDEVGKLIQSDDSGHEVSVSYESDRDDFSSEEIKYMMRPVLKGIAP